MAHTLGDLDDLDNTDPNPPPAPPPAVREIKPVEMYGHQGAPVRKDFRAIVVPADAPWLEPTDADLRKIEQLESQGILDLTLPVVDPADAEAEKLARQAGSGNA